jgi:hypothetical protein
MNERECVLWFVGAVGVSAGALSMHVCLNVYLGVCARVWCTCVCE